MKLILILMGKTDKAFVKEGFKLYRALSIINSEPYHNE